MRIAFRRTGDGDPLLLLHGALCDSMAWRAELEELADEFTVIARVRRIGHEVALEAPEAFHAELRRFLGSISRPGPSRWRATSSG